MNEAGSYLTPPPQRGETIRSLDARAIEEFGIPGILLMENAGEACARFLTERALAPSDPLGAPFHVVCGPGNNGGDGFVIARHLANRGFEVTIYLSTAPGGSPPGSDAGTNLEICRRMGLPIETDPASPEGLARLTNLEVGCIVDAIFGTGLSREVGAPQRAWIEAMRVSRAPVVSVDIPSGLDADSGTVHGLAVKAHHTLTFVAPKRGFQLERGPELTGEVHEIGISIPRNLLEELL